MRRSTRLLSLCSRALGGVAAAEAPAAVLPGARACAGGWARPISGAALLQQRTLTPAAALPFSVRPFSGSAAVASSDSDDDSSSLYNFIEYPPSEAFVGQPAPGFKCDAWVGGEIKPVSLKEFTKAGKYVVLVWYPKDFTFVCPTEIIAFSDRAAEFVALGAQVVVASTDTAEVHGAWTRVARSAGGLGKIDVPMLADQTKAVAARYGVLLEDAGIALRGTFIIGPDGVLHHASINNLGIGRSVDETLRTLQAIQFYAQHGEVCPAGWQPGEEGIDVSDAGKYFSSVPDEGGAAAASYGASLPLASTAADLDAAIAGPAALVFVGASWCGKCKQLAPLIEQLAAGAGGKLAVVKVDASSPGGLAEDKLGVAKGAPLPAVRLFKGGKQVAAVSGYKPGLVKDEVAKLLQ